MNIIKNIICLEAEWEFNSHEKDNKFGLNTQPLMNWLREYHKCDVIYRHILDRNDIEHYLRYFDSHKREFKNYDVVYISCHGWNGQIALEGEDGEIDLMQLADMAGDFFNGRIVHFGACKTLANEKVVDAFKKKTGARLVSGYQLSVDPMRSAIADIAYFNELMKYENVGAIKNESSSLWRTYSSLLNELQFVAF